MADSKFALNQELPEVETSRLPTQSGEETPNFFDKQSREQWKSGQRSKENRSKAYTC